MTCDLGERRKVLIVNSDKAEAEEIAEKISCCFDTEQAGTMREALSRLNAGGIISCIVIDPILPNGQGVGLIDRLRKLFPQIPLLVVLSWGMAPPEEYNKAGITHVISAPVSPESLRRELFDCVARDEAAKVMAPLVEESESIRSTLNRNSAIIRQVSST